MKLEFSNKTILLVEDDSAIVKMLSRRIKKTGYRLHVADNGSSGYSQALFLRPDLILMDLQMPVMGGIEATLKLRKVGYTGFICALTASATGDDIKRSLEAGCDCFIAKPIGVDFEERIKAILEKKS